jgi:hypothetical protein
VYLLPIKLYFLLRVKQGHPFVCLFVCYLTILSVSRMYRIGDRLINKYGALCRMRIVRGKSSTGRKPATALLDSPQIPHELTWD